MGIILRGMKNVLRNPIRLLLVVVLLGTSLMFVAAMVSLHSSAQQEIAQVHTQVGTSITINYVQNNEGVPGKATGGGTASPTSASPPSDQMVEIPNSVVGTISNIAGVVQAEETVRLDDSDGKLVSGSIPLPNGKSLPLPPAVYGVSNGAIHYTIGSGTTPRIVSGTNFLTKGSNSDVAMMGQALAKLNKLKVGSTFTLQGKIFKLVAIYDPSTASDADPIANDGLIIPLSVAQKLYGLKGVDTVTAYAATYDQVNTAAIALKNKLGPKYDVVSSADTYKSTFDALGVAQNSIYLALIVAIVVAIVVIIFTVFIVVRERTTEIGVLKAIGASHWQVIRQFWGEVLAMSSLGAFIGIILLAIFGPILSNAFNLTPSDPTAIGNQITASGAMLIGAPSSNQFSNIHIAAATLTLETVLIIIGSGIALAVFTSVIPAWYIARIKPAVVLRKSN